MTPIELVRVCAEDARYDVQPALRESLVLILAAYDARGELIAAYDESFGRELAYLAPEPEADRIRKARKATDSAVAAVEGRKV